MSWRFQWPQHWRLLQTENSMKQEREHFCGISTVILYLHRLKMTPRLLSAVAMENKWIKAALSAVRCDTAILTKLVLKSGAQHHADEFIKTLWLSMLMREQINRVRSSARSLQDVRRSHAPFLALYGCSRALRPWRKSAVKQEVK